MIDEILKVLPQQRATQRSFVMGGDACILHYMTHRAVYYVHSFYIIGIMYMSHLDNSRACYIVLGEVRDCFI